ncbi:MAG TPA: hypothetical protein VGV13_01305 [Methylomirabilota bacterium]|jgi:hypothetical protein|nr:hypothetical protein [Methylomirabilota bacterium]
MTTPLRLAAASLVAGLVLSAAAALAAQTTEGKPRETLFVGVDTSGSFRQDYDNAMSFLAYYLYGHLNGLGGLGKPRNLFVAAIGGRQSSEPKAFRPIHDFQGKDIAQIETDLRRWFVPTDGLTDFNPFFVQVARIAKERGLVLSAITVMVVSDGVPDIPVPNLKDDPMALYRQIDLRPLEYLSKNITVRLAYASPKVGDNWRRHVPRQRVRLWATEVEVMKGWRAQLMPGAQPAEQARLWKWVRDNVDFRVRSRGL